MRRRRLEIEDGPLSLPLGEISGVCQAYGTQRQELRLLAIGDDSPIVIAVDIEPGPNGRPVPNDLTTVLSASTVPIGNWEAIATDGDGRVFILQEDPGAVVILDADLQQLLHTVHLHVDPDRAIGHEWTSEPRSRGEGLVLLGHGHLLVIKEKKPKRLLEFGPGGAAARGISPSTVLPVQERFPVPSNTARIEFEFLKQWKFDDAAEHEMDDLSDAAVGPDGRIYLLSDQSRRIARIQERVGPDEEHVSLDASWDLPAQIAKPEGLTISHNWTPIVAVDNRSRKEISTFSATCGHEPAKPRHGRHRGATTATTWPTTTTSTSAWETSATSRSSSAPLGTAASACWQTWSWRTPRTSTHGSGPPRPAAGSPTVTTTPGPTCHQPRSITLSV